MSKDDDIKNRVFNISNDGTIFEIKDDGSISKLAQISESGNIVPLDGTSSSDTRKGILPFFLVVLIIVTLVFVGLYLEQKDKHRLISNQLQYTTSELSYFEEKYKEFEEKYREIEEQNQTLKSRLDNFGEKIPFIVNDIRMGNVYRDGTIQTDYGNTIYSSSTMYLKPQIEYDGIIAGNHKVYYKLFRPDGSLSTGSSSPYGYTTDDNIYILNGEKLNHSLTGWGNEHMGHWHSGTYRIEIWCNGICTKAKTFTIY